VRVMAAEQRVAAGSPVQGKTRLGCSIWTAACTKTKSAARRTQSEQRGDLKGDGGAELHGGELR
jgi:hypothetical protein